jgi:Ca2+-binding EF-hand superfamily protein
MKTMSTLAALALIASATPVWAQTGAAKAVETPRNAPVARGHSKNEFMETYDANKDGKVSKEEFAARRGEDHKGLDLNQNKQVNEMEYVTEYTFRLDKELAEQRGRQIRQAHFRFGVLDTDKDGLLSAEEFAESGSRMFSRLDTNKDGFVDKQDTATGF